MADKLMNIPNDDTQNYPYCRFKLVVEMFENEPTKQSSIKVPNFVKPKNKNMSLKDFRDYCNKQPSVPSLPASFQILDYLTLMKNHNIFNTFKSIFILCFFVWTQSRIG